ncbi:MAG: NAD-dependent epimerase/dehydratase family protein [Solirubrobacterales bacterium]
MRILVAGATGVIGKQLIPRLVGAGHEVTGMTRSESKRRLVSDLGATPVIADALDPEQVATAVAEAEPEAIVHQLTALDDVNVRKFARSFALTNRLRTEATDHLLSAGRAAGVRRFVAQSFAGWPYARDGAAVKSEDEPLDPSPPAQMRETLEAIRYLERAVAEDDRIEGVALRYGGFYGPGTSLAPGGEQLEAIRRRRFPIVGDGGGMLSLIHVADAADATAVALERGASGVYNVVDDDPVPAREFITVLSEELGVGKPRRVPRWIGRLIAGEAAVTMLTEGRGASNAKAKRELGWEPKHASWRDNLATGR